MKQSIGKFIMWLIGWKVTGRYPREIKKFVVLAAPHTSNWDFPLGILTNMVQKTHIKFIAKHTLFKPGIGWLFRALGGYPVDRTKRSNFADSVVDLFNTKEDFVITIAAEGKRGRVKRFKTGVYYIATGAGIPIVPTKFDYKNREIHFGKPFYPTGEREKDMNYLWDYFIGVQPKNPENGIFPRES